jgi:hypothetical protein
VAKSLNVLAVSNFLQFMHVSALLLPLGCRTCQCLCTQYSIPTHQQPVNIMP